jgi:hypothetical protein
MTWARKKDEIIPYPDPPPREGPLPPPPGEVFCPFCGRRTERLDDQDKMACRRCGAIFILKGPFDFGVEDI